MITYLLMNNASFSALDKILKFNNRSLQITISFLHLILLLDFYYWLELIFHKVLRRREGKSKKKRERREERGEEIR